MSLRSSVPPNDLAELLDATLADDELWAELQVLPRSEGKRDTLFVVRSRSLK
jgi:hypothetical protein